MWSVLVFSVLILLLVRGNQAFNYAVPRRFGHFSEEDFKNFENLENFVSGGNKNQAKKGDFPGMVSLRLDSGLHLCSGTIIAEDWVLTTLTCMEQFKCFREPEKDGHYPLWAMAGEVKMYHESRWKNKKHYVTDFYLYPLWPDKPGDLSLLKIAPPFKLDKNIQVMPMMLYDEIDDGSKCKVAGWGRHNEKPQGWTHKNASLYWMDAKTIKSNDGAKILATDPSNAQFACPGDAGSGLICEGVMVGVLAEPEGCGPNPGSYVSLKYFEFFITHTMKKQPMKPDLLSGDIPQAQANVLLYFLLCSLVIVYHQRLTLSLFDQ